jgi:tetratricopeptide (TPR) repeat protein
VRLGPPLAALVVLAAIAPAARAEREAAIVVASADGAVDALTLAGALGAAGVAWPDAVAEVAAARAAGAEPAATLARFAEVGNLIGEGWRAYVAAEPAFAAARLGAARTAAVALLPYDGGGELYADASLRLGIALGHLGQRERADDALRLAHALDPTRPVTTAEFSPDAVDAYQAAIAAARPTVTVRIDALAGAAVTIDGQPAGTAPRLVELAVGVHVIGVRAPGFAPVVEPFEVGPETSLIALELPPDRGAIAAARAQADGFAALGERDAAALLDAIVSYTEADAVVLVAATVRTGGPALLGQRCHSGATCTAVVEVGYPIGGDLARAIALLRQRLADADHRYRPSLAGDPRLRPTGGPPVGGGGDGGARRRWLWIGGGAVLAAVAAVAITAWASGDDRPTVTVDPDDFTR